MNNPKLGAEKLVALASMANRASTDFEKAAVFAATEAIAAQFFEDEDRFDSYLLENVEKARWSICAAVGYEVANGHDTRQHLVWALAAATAVLDEIERVSR